VVWRDVLRYHRHAHVPRLHRLHLFAGGGRADQESKPRRRRGERTLLALRRSGLDVCVPDDLFAVDFDVIGCLSPCPFGRRFGGTKLFSLSLWEKVRRDEVILPLPLGEGSEGRSYSPSPFGRGLG